MRFVVDAQLPPALARLLTAKGHSAVHVEDVGLRDADDSPIWGYALDNEGDCNEGRGFSASSAAKSAVSCGGLVEDR